MPGEVSHQADGENTLVSGDAPARQGHQAPIQDSRGGMGAGDSAAAPVVSASDRGCLLAWWQPALPRKIGPVCCRVPGKLPLAEIWNLSNTSHPSSPFVPPALNILS